MSDLKNYLKAFKNYNFEHVKEYLDSQNILGFEEKCSHIHNFFKEVDFKEVKSSKKELRKNFFEELCIYFKDDEVKNYTRGKLEVLEYIENAFVEVESIRDNHNFYKNFDNSIIKKIISGFESFLSSQLYELKVVHESSRLEDGLEKSDEINQVLFVSSDVLTLNLKFIAYSKGWFNDNLLLIPDEVVINDEEYEFNSEDLNFVISITRLWIFIENKYTEWRYLDTDLTIRDIENLKEILDEESFRTIKGKHDNYLECDTSPLYPYACIAQKRLSRMLNNQSLQAYNFYRKSMNAENFIGVYNQELIIAIIILCNTLHVLPTAKFGELTMEEWVTCFFTLNQDARSKQGQRVYSQEDFRSMFPKNITAAKVDYFIQIMSFKKNTLDIFDAPLIRTSSGKIIYLSNFWHDTNYVNIFLSVTGRNDINVDKKGKYFEISVMDFFNKHKNLGLEVFDFKTKVKGDEFQYDAIVVWEEYVFIIECKNRSILDSTTNSMKNFSEKMDQYIKQVSRLERFYRNNISIFQKEFNIDLKNKKIMPIILNALPFSLGSDIEGIYFLDYSILSKFFETKKLGKRNLETNELEEVVCDWWSGDIPKANDLYEVVKSPFQVTTEMDNIKVNYNFIEIGGFLFLKDIISLKSEPMIEVKKTNPNN